MAGLFTHVGDDSLLVLETPPVAEFDGAHVGYYAHNPVGGEQEIIDAYSWALVSQGWAADAQGYALDAFNSLSAVDTAVADSQAAAASAESSATAAAGSASSALASEIAAAGSASSASASATAAGLSELDAEGAATSASDSATAASASATSASNSATAASGSATTAGLAEAKAQDWATELEDVVVEPGLYSALHHATKAAASAAAAATYDPASHASVDHKFHQWGDGEYAFDDYTGGKNLRLFINTARGDIVRYRAISAIEYYNGTTWVAWTGAESIIQALLDGNENTVATIPYANRSFRFTVAMSSGWPTTTLLVLQTGWHAAAWPGATVTVDVAGVSVGSAVFTGANGFTNWGYAARAVNGLHEGTVSKRVTIELGDFVSGSVNLQRFMVLTNYITKLDPWITTYPGAVNFDVLPKAAGNDLVSTAGVQSIAGAKTFTDEFIKFTNHPTSVVDVYTTNEWCALAARSYQNGQAFNYGGAITASFARGTVAAPVAVEADDIVGWLGFEAFSGTYYSWPMYLENVVVSRAGTLIHTLTKFRAGGGTGTRDFLSWNSSTKAMVFGDPIDGGATFDFRGDLSFTGTLTAGTVPFARVGFSSDGNIGGNLDSTNWPIGIYNTLVSGANATYPTGYGLALTGKQSDTRSWQLYMGHTVSDRMWFRNMNAAATPAWFEIATRPWVEANHVGLTGNQTVDGLKTFTSYPSVDRAATSSYVQLRTNGVIRGYLYADDANQVGFLNNAGSWAWRIQSDGTLLAGTVPIARVTGRAVLTRGTGLTGNNYDVGTATTWAVSYGTAAGTACVGNDARLTNSREWTATTVSDAEAQLGTATTRRAWTAATVHAAARRANASVLVLSASRTMTTADKGAVIYKTSTSAFTLTTAEAALATGDMCLIQNRSTSGLITVALGTSQVIHWFKGDGTAAATGARTIGIGGTATLIKIAANTWHIFGGGIA